MNKLLTAKLLGVLIVDKLTKRSQIDKLTKKIASGIGPCNESGILSLVRHSIYQALVQPHFNHCNIFWGKCGATLLEKLQKLQNRAARVLTYSNNDADVNNLLST